MVRTLRLMASAALLAGLVVVYGATSSQAVDCVGPDDPPGCVTPAPSVVPDPVPSVSVSPDPAPDASASASPSPAVSATADPATVLLDTGQFDALVWLGGAVLATSLVALVGSWSR